MASKKGEQAFDAIWKAFLLGASPKSVEDGIRAHMRKKYFKRINQLANQQNVSRNNKVTWVICGVKTGEAAKDLGGSTIDRADFDLACDQVRKRTTKNSGPICPRKAAS
jgi:hypothetical protein